jgi:D-3-phosphoglycerate dehydrogenase / 2-oxoglutarate reductase
MSRCVVAVADDAFPNRREIEQSFTDVAELRWADLSSPEAARVSTKQADAVVVTLQRMSADVIAAFDSSVRIISRAGVGLDSIDLEAAQYHGVAVVNQPAYGASEVATHALAMMLALQRRLLGGDRFVRDGWKANIDLARIKPLDEATVGVVGCGRIGQAFIERVAAIVGRVLVYDPAPAGVPAAAQRLDSLDELLERSELLTLHVPLVAQTRNLIGRAELQRLPAGAIVVNVARGGILDEDALADLLRSGHLGGAGLDVFAEEPLPATSPLLTSPNTILTPHCAAASDRAAHRLSHWTIADALAYLDHGSVTHGSVVVEGDRPK